MMAYVIEMKHEDARYCRRIELNDFEAAEGIFHDLQLRSAKGVLGNYKVTLTQTYENKVLYFFEKSL